MLDVCLLGTGGMMPLPYRWLTALMVRCSGSNLLIDCGEGTQIALKEKGWSPKPVDVICFTHYHADHISGLPGLLLTMGNAERTEPITMIGPKGLERVVTALRTIAPELPFPLEFIELTEPRQQLQIGPYVIDAYRVNHNVTCYGYSISIPRKGRFDVERARAQEIPQKFWSRLQKGETIEEEGRTLTPDGKEAKAREYKHMTFQEAAHLAKEAQPKEMWLTHYSPSLIRPDDYMDKVREIFPRAKAARDGWTAELGFDEE